ncbi:hypothetical protein AB1I77_25455 [Bacillus paranthracis]|uniref:hypothetical protein n=1 Tax=Bacillus cereus group TaxID=86661 RepID=UPI0008FDDC04|nr:MULTISPECIES: hypothetical protein [Bacillus cereus group]HDR7875924.1 hypothetical protein [Bacillus mobilis]MBM6771683.1 hypothetical protein [Bacillus cereus]MCC2380812.1 hypothetical protein [Bacillus wiedmannii]MCC2425004.1 hypothetical protein [Bacillus wiedmannii]MCC2494395.1 hypothetical protein [Bacillus cereus]
MIASLRKKQVINFHDFMDGSYKEKEAIKKAEDRAAVMLCTSAVVYMISPQVHAFAFGEGIQKRIIHAFDPVISLIQGISYPVAFIMISTGFLLIMTGQKHRGLSCIKWASIGYVGAQLAPALMDILVDIGKEMRK